MNSSNPMRSPFQCQSADTLSANLWAQANARTLVPAVSVQVSVRHAQCMSSVSLFLHRWIRKIQKLWLRRGWQKREWSDREMCFCVCTSLKKSTEGTQRREEGWLNIHEHLRTEMTATSVINILIHAPLNTSDWLFIIQMMCFNKQSRGRKI